MLTPIRDERADEQDPVVTKALREDRKHGAKSSKKSKDKEDDDVDNDDDDK